MQFILTFSLICFNIKYNFASILDHFMSDPSFLLLFHFTLPSTSSNTFHFTSSLLPILLRFLKCSIHTLLTFISSVAKVPTLFIFSVDIPFSLNLPYFFSGELSSLLYSPHSSSFQAVYLDILFFLFILHTYFLTPFRDLIIAFSTFNYFFLPPASVFRSTTHY